MYEEIIHFWFQEIDKSQRWIKNAEFDAFIKRKFIDIHHQAINCELFSWRKTSLGTLAEIIVLDQFSRNMYRDTPRSFAYDSLALAFAQTAVLNGHDRELTVEQRSFLYMPYMHSESPVIHIEAEALFTNLGLHNTLNFEKKHKAIIDRFGRYPHRNKILGRSSSPEELEFLSLPGSRF